jgi:hypothetical protein
MMTLPPITLAALADYAASLSPDVIIETGLSNT